MNLLAVSIVFLSTLYQSGTKELDMIQSDFLTGGITAEPTTPKMAPRSWCGVDKSPHETINEGLVHIGTYPWLGILYYPIGENFLTTVVVLVARDLVLGSAMDVDKMPKRDFRERARVILSKNCSGPPTTGIRVLDYTYHTDFGKTLTAPVLVQLDLTDILSFLGTTLHPICGPPDQLFAADFYAMVLPDDCQNSMVEVYKMEYVSPSDCDTFYRRNNLDMASLQPKHTACAKAMSGGKCVWKNGVVLAVKQHGLWHLLGFGVYGPGCERVSRYLDYGVYEKWVDSSIRRSGLPAVTRVDDNQIIMRYSRDLPRYGNCDLEELKREIYEDSNMVHPYESPGTWGIANYNLTLDTTIDYSCVKFRADYPYEARVDEKPRVSLRFYCTSPSPICYQTGFEQLNLYVSIYFVKEIIFTIKVYGRERRVIDPKLITRYANSLRPRPRVIRPPYDYYIFTTPPTTLPPPPTPPPPPPPPSPPYPLNPPSTYDPNLYADQFGNPRTMKPPR